MANRSEKKRAEKEKKFGLFYLIFFFIAIAVWLPSYLYSLFWHRTHISGFGYTWRALAVFFGFFFSLKGITNNLSLGLEFSLSNDLFIITAAGSILSVLTDHSYKLFFLVPLYGIYKLVLFIYNWFTAPVPEPPHEPEELEPKTHVKYITVGN